MKKYTDYGIYDFSDFAEELTGEAVIYVNGGACGGSISYSPTAPSGAPTGITGPSSPAISAPTAPSYGQCGGAPAGGGGGGSAPSSSSYGQCGGNFNPFAQCGGGTNNSNGNSDDRNPSEGKDLSKVYELNDIRWAWCVGDDLSDGRISDDYGYTEDRKQLAEEMNISEFHHGVDIAAEKGERLNSMMDGTVTEVGYSDDLGNYVVIKLDGSSTGVDNGASIKYGHCDTINVEVGQSVVAGEKVATVGNTGKYSTGPHVHIAYDGDGDGNYCSNTAADNPMNILYPGY